MQRLLTKLNRKPLVLALFSIVLATGLVALVCYYKYFRETESCTGNFDLIILDAEVLDGLGHQPFKTDVGIKDGHISCIGRMDGAVAARVIEAEGLTLAPGFVDVHTHVERNLPRGSGPFLAPNFIRQGVTTVITGNCGRSSLPLREMFDLLDKNGSQINVASLVGHNSIRQRVMKQETGSPTSQELADMKKLVSQAMDDGALGLSTGLVYSPGLFAKPDELVELARVVAGKNGLYASHIRDEGLKGSEAIQEAISIGKQANLPVHISHFKAQGKHEWGSAQARLDLLHAAIRGGQRVTLDQYPYTASSTGLAVLMPSWLFAYDLKTINLKLRDPKFLAKVRTEMIADIHSNGWDDYSFARVAYCDFDKSLNGLSINEIAARPDRSAAQITAASWSPARRSDHQERKSANPEPAQSESSLERQTDVVIQLFARGGAQMVFFDMAEDDVLTIMREPGVMFGSDSAVREESTSAIPHPRGLGTFPRILGRYVRENHVLALEDAVRRMTSLPAKTFGLAQRGQIGVGYWADLVLFDPKTTIDQASYEHPLNYPVGIAYVIVNGSIVLDPYGPTSAAPGKALRFRPGNLDH